MRKTITLSDFMKIAVPVIGIVALVLIMSSCGTGHVSCDAYGQNDIEYGNISENEAR
jgi:hypothetical protein